MLVSVSYNVSRLFTSLLAALSIYKEGLSKFNLELTYGSSKLQVGEFFVSDSVMEGSFEQAENSCFRQRGHLFYVLDGMNLTDIFEKIELSSIWVNIRKNEGERLYFDYDELPPLTKTEYNRIDASLLTDSEFTGQKAVILENTQGSFQYKLVSATEPHRSLCMIRVKFPRKMETQKILLSFQEQFLDQLKDIEKSIFSASRMANNSMYVTPELPSNFILSNARQVPFESEILEKIQKFTRDSSRVVDRLRKIKEPENIIQIIFEHNSLLSTLQNLEGEILEPLYKPLVYVEDNSDLKPGAQLQLFAIGNEKLVFQVEPPSDLSVTSTTIGPTSRPRDTSTVPTEPTTTTLRTSTIDLMDERNLYDAVTGVFVSSSTTTTTSTTVTTTTPKYNGLPTLVPGTSGPIHTPTLPPSEQSWWDWFVTQIGYAKTVAGYITISWKFPSIWDLVLGSVSFCHTITLIIFCQCCQRKTQAVTKKFSIARLFGRRQNRTNTVPKDAEADPEEEVIPMIVRNTTPKVTVRKTDLNIETEREREMKKPVKSVMKRTAPTPPVPSAPYLYNEYQAAGTSVYGGGGGARPKVKGYLKTSIPVYLMQSDISLDQNF